MATSYLDRLRSSGNLGMKAPCVVATTAAITLSGAQTINGVAVVAGDRVLVKNQSSSIDNGIWIAATGAWSRAKDFNGSLDAGTGTQVFVVGGTVAPLTMYRLTTANTVDIGTDNITWAVAWSADPDTQNAVARAARPAGVLLVRDSFPSTDTSPDFALYDVDGERQSLSASTTDGLDEAFDLVAATAENLWVCGAGRVNPSGTSKGSIVLTTPLQMPALDCVNVHLETAIVSTDNATISSGEPGFQIDSFALATMRLVAQFTGDHAGPVIEINPETNGGGDANKQIGVADIFLLGAINNITTSGSKAILINASAGTNISRSNFRIMESNGGEIGVDIRTTSTGTIHGCHFDLFGGHDYGTTGYAIGVTGGTQILGCSFNIRNYGASGGTYGLRVGTSRCSFVYNNDGNAQTTEVSIESGAVKNDVHLLRWDGNITDASDKSNAIHLPGRWVIEVDRNGTDQTSIADNTFTKVQHTTERHDTYAAYDNATNYRATIAVPGWYAVHVQSAWVTGEDALELYDAIYVDGVQKKARSVQPGGAAGNVSGPGCYAELYLTKDQYVEHFVLQNGTGSRDLLGATQRTWMTIRRIG